MHFFRFKSIDYFKANNLHYVTEHKQVRDGLKEYDLAHYSSLLAQLHNLRKKADYNLEEDLTKHDVDKSINLMNKIIKSLSFN